MVKIKSVYSALYNPSSKYFLAVNDILAALTLISIAGVVLSTVDSLSAYQPYFTFIEFTTVSIFTLEYFARIYAHGKQWRKYMTSFYGIVDLLAIAPTYLGLSNLTALKSARIFRVLQLFRALRILKVTHLADLGLDEEPADARLYRITVQIYFFTLFSAALIFGTLIHLFEPEMPAFSNIPLSMLWATKPLMGGVAQTEPMTVAGNIVVALTRFTGLMLFGLLVNLVGSSLNRFILGKPKR